MRNLQLSAVIVCLFVLAAQSYRLPSKYCRTSAWQQPIQKQSINPARHQSKSTRLHLDVFGLGPAEILIIIGAYFVFFGQTGFINPFNKDKKDDNDSRPTWQIERFKNIEERRKLAKEARTLRALKRYVESPDDEDEDDE
jgi:hypothetical protein